MEKSDQEQLQEKTTTPDQMLIQGKVDRFKGMEFSPPKCHLMNVAVKHGFYFHHANAKGGYVLMCLWLDQTTHDKIPSYPDHYTGVGGAIINDKDEILMIQENRSAEPRPWKLPGGFMDPGETIKQSAEREVYEETGIKSEFVGLLGIRELLQFKYGATDLYIVCLMKMNEGQEINILDKREVHAAQWIPIREIISNEDGICKYKLFQNAYQFVSGINKLYLEYKQGEEEGISNAGSLSEYVRSQAMTYSEFEPKNTSSAKYSISEANTWKFYLPQAFKSETKL
ncbi:nudix domain-containing protein [Stylonychia lemnae]|uniref:Nudix domain-containing protein n=1 Tax=Stylonychia lemnae TaxID=5949 RepID=A0A078AVM6_STYLE|nr:nudix domain-containing protein [Stylonychia lemnae]|eukprot:CDW85317.1 nudix domain-containing protein [Stylonychia lemnae]